MKHCFRILAAVLLLLVASEASGQRWKLQRYEAEIYLGGVSFHGDIGPANRPLANMFNGYRPSVGVIPRYMIRKDLAVSLDLGYLIYAGKDEEGSSHNRLYSFNSHAFQHFARLEYFIIGEAGGRGRNAIYNRRGMINNYDRVYLYIYGGLGGIMSKATVHDENQNGNEPLSNPGYDPSLQYTLAFPVGGGIKFSVDPRWSVGVELGYHFTISDKLDGYAPAASNYKDAYYLTTVKAVYRIRNDRFGKPIFGKYYR
jgi:opacity protein-like surface antigen